MSHGLVLHIGLTSLHLSPLDRVVQEKLLRNHETMNLSYFDHCARLSKGKHCYQLSNIGETLLVGICMAQNLCPSDKIDMTRFYVIRADLARHKAWKCNVRTICTWCIISSLRDEKKFVVK